MSLAECWICRMQCISRYDIIDRAGSSGERCTGCAQQQHRIIRLIHGQGITVVPLRRAKELRPLQLALPPKFDNKAIVSPLKTLLKRIANWQIVAFSMSSDENIAGVVGHGAMCQLPQRAAIVCAENDVTV